MSCPDRPSRAPRRLAFAFLALAILALLGYCVAQRPQVVFDAPSEFGRVRVMESSDGLRALYTGPGRARQSAVYPGRPEHLELAYSRVAMVGLAVAPPNPRILFVGLGGGAMPMFTRHTLPTAHLDVVEIDPVIVDVAQRYFGVQPDSNLVLHTGDGRAFIERAPPAAYDLVFLDAFSDDEIPRALATREFLTSVQRVLGPEGLVLSNLWTAGEDYTSMVATYAAVFPQVRLIEVPRRAQVILIAGSEGPDLSLEGLLDAAERLQRQGALDFDLVDLVEAGYSEILPPGGDVIID